MQFLKISILPGQKGLEFLGSEVRGSVRSKNLKKFMKVNWNFQRGGWGILEKNPFLGEVWIFYGSTHCLGKVFDKTLLVCFCFIDYIAVFSMLLKGVHLTLLSQSPHS